MYFCFHLFKQNEREKDNNIYQLPGGASGWVSEEACLTTDWLFFSNLKI